MPTFGYPTIGGSSVNMNYPGLMGSKFTLAEAADLESISAYFHTGGANNDVKTRCCIYSDNAGAPNAPVGELTNEASTPINTPAAWVTHTFAAPQHLEPGTYWIFLFAGDNSSFFLFLYYTSGSANQWANNNGAQTYPTRPNPFGTPVYYPAKASIYATYSDVSLPTVTTEEISDITSDSASGGGDVTDDGGGTVSAFGVCWNTTGSPTIADPHTDDA